jgi:hypothetical protein
MALRISPLVVITALTGTLTIWAGTAWCQAPLGPAKSDSPVTLENSAAFLRLDLTKKGDKTSPVIRLGYQSPMGSAIRQMRKSNPQSDIHNVPYFSVNLAGVPSSDIANLFNGRDVSAGGDVQISFGQAYLASWVTPRDLSLTSGFLKNLTNSA